MIENNSAPCTALPSTVDDKGRLYCPPSGRDRPARRRPLRLDGVYEALLFGFYNRHTGQCFPSHQAIAPKARCSVATVKRALKWAKDNALISWAHGLVRDGWRVIENQQPLRIRRLFNHAPHGPFIRRH